MRVESDFNKRKNGETKQVNKNQCGETLLINDTVGC